MKKLLALYELKNVSTSMFDLSLKELQRVAALTDTVRIAVHSALSRRGSPACPVSIIKKSVAKAQVRQRRVKKMSVHRSLIIDNNENRALR